MWESTKEIAKQEVASVSMAEAVQAAQWPLQGLQLLLIAYAKAKSKDNNPSVRYGELRIFWGQFLNFQMSTVKNVV